MLKFQLKDGWDDYLTITNPTATLTHLKIGVMMNDGKITLVNKGKDFVLELIVAQRIFQFQAANPRISDVYTIKEGEPYEFVNNELIGTGHTRKGKKAQSEE